MLHRWSIRLLVTASLRAVLFLLALTQPTLATTQIKALNHQKHPQSTRRTSPTRTPSGIAKRVAQGAWLCTRPSTSLGEVDHPQARRAEDGRVGATPDDAVRLGWTRSIAAHFAARRRAAQLLV